MKRLFNILSTAVVLTFFYVMAHRYAYPGAESDRQYGYFQLYLALPTAIAIFWLIARFCLTHKWTENVVRWTPTSRVIGTILGGALLAFIIKFAAFLIKEL